MKDSNIVQIKNLSHIYDQRKTDGVQGLNLDVKAGEVMALIGPSGSGKTTTLKCLANLLPTHEGEIQFGESVTISYVDQYPNLDEDKTVFENLEAAILDIEDKEKRANQVRTALTQLEITNEIESKVKDISGGQKQRAIIGKALVKNPTLLLLDEPFANLDKTLRTTLLEELFLLFKERNMTVVWVTHNTEEALSYSDRLVLLNYGKIQQVGKPIDLYYRPNNLFTANFFGHTNIIASKVIQDDGSELLVSLFNKEYLIPKPENFNLKDHKETLLIMHPENLIYDSESRMKGKIEQTIFKGSRTLLEINYQGTSLWAEVNSFLNFKKGDKFSFSLNTKNIHCLDEI